MTKKTSSPTLAAYAVERAALAPRVAERPALIERAEAAANAAREAEHARRFDPQRRHSNQPDHELIALSGAANDRREELQRLREEQTEDERRLRALDRWLGAAVGVQREAAALADQTAALEDGDRRAESLDAMAAEAEQEIAADAAAIAAAEEAHADEAVQARLAGRPLPSADPLAQLESKRQAKARMRDRLREMSAKIRAERDGRREAIAAARARLADAQLARAEVEWTDASASLIPVAAALLAAQRAAGQYGARDGVRVDVPEARVAAALVALRSEVEPLRVAPAATAGAEARAVA